MCVLICPNMSAKALTLCVRVPIRSVVATEPPFLKKNCVLASTFSCNSTLSGFSSAVLAFGASAHAR